MEAHVDSPDGERMMVFERPQTDGFISVVIPVFRDAPGLVQTLTSLAQQTLPRSRYEIIVCNDGDERAITDVCREYSVREVCIRPNRGSYYARNRGVEQSTGQYLAFVDADIRVPKNWLEIGRNALQTADYVGGPVIVDETQARTPAHYYEVMTGFRGNRPEGEHNFFVTANLFTTRRVFENVGGFDERLRSGGDNEFGTRVFGTGEYAQRFENELAVFHPPRGYRKLVQKKIRVARGKTMLNYLYPDRYNYSHMHIARHVLNILLPPKISSARRRYRPNPHFGFARHYLFSWRFKAEVALKLLPVYYGRSRNEGTAQPRRA